VTYSSQPSGADAKMLQQKYKLQQNRICVVIAILNYFIMGVWNQVAQYLYLKKKDPNAPNSQFVKYMHGINRISILLFLTGMVILVVKLLRR
jgi:Ni,Fe-hydrogenase I cytochrome b subunit